MNPLNKKEEGKKKVGNEPKKIGSKLETSQFDKSKSVNSFSVSLITKGKIVIFWRCWESIPTLVWIFSFHISIKI